MKSCFEIPTSEKLAEDFPTRLLPLSLDKPFFSPMLISDTLGESISYFSMVVKSKTFKLCRHRTSDSWSLCLKINKDLEKRQTSNSPSHKALHLSLSSSIQVPKHLGYSYFHLQALLCKNRTPTVQH